MNKVKLALILAATVSINHAQAADILWSGFGSVIGGQVLGGSPSPTSSASASGISKEAFLADYSRVGLYDSESPSYTPDTTFGLQAKAKINPRATATVQLIATGAEDFNPSIDWAYLSYRLSSSFKLEAGRKRLPTFYYSDYYDVGYAYNWIRPPGSTYTWQISKYNGINLSHSGMLGDIDITTNFYTGNEVSSRNPLMSFLLLGDTRENWNDMIGITTQLDFDWLDIRLSVQDGEIERETLTGPLASPVTFTDYQFFGLSFNVTLDNAYLLTEWQLQDRHSNKASTTVADNVTGYLISGGYVMGDITPYFSYSALIVGKKDKIHLDTGLLALSEDHNTSSIGLRWNFDKKIAFKVQYDDFKDDSAFPVTGDSQLLSAGFDFIF